MTASLFRLTGARQRVVGTEGTGRNAQVAHTRVVGEYEGDRNGCLAGASALVEHVGDRLGGEGAALVRLGEREVDLRGAVDIEQTQQPAGGASPPLTS
jgi:hypothetical protein